MGEHSFDICTTYSPLTHAPHHHVRFNGGARSDLAWLSAFLDGWNGISILAMHHVSSPQHVVVSDMSDHLGYGAYHQRAWFQLSSAGSAIVDASITVKELIPSVAAAAIGGSNGRGKQWSGEVVMCKCDNQSVVAAITLRTSHNKTIMHLLHCLKASWDCKLHVVPSHIPGKHDELADDLSRNRLLSFPQKAPSMAPTPCTIPQPLRDLLLDPVDWTSAAWRTRFTSSLRLV